MLTRDRSLVVSVASKCDSHDQDGKRVSFGAELPLSEGMNHVRSYPMVSFHSPSSGVCPVWLW